jgi:hypothetical protein
MFARGSSSTDSRDAQPHSVPPGIVQAKMAPVAQQQRSPRHLGGTDDRTEEEEEAIIAARDAMMSSFG